MSTSNKPTIVPPKEWRDRTSLVFSSRSESTKQLDIAYDNWYNAKHGGPALTYSTPTPKQLAMLKESNRIVEIHRAALQERLQEYLYEHGGGLGGNWDKCERNKASNGLLKFIYDTIKIENPRLAGVRRAVNNDNAHSRYGVLYLLGNINIDMSCMDIALEGVGAVGGAIAAGLGTDYGQLKDVDKVDLQTGAENVIGKGTKYNSTIGRMVLEDNQLSVSSAYTQASDAGTFLVKRVAEKMQGSGAPGSSMGYARVVGASELSTRRSPFDVPRAEQHYSVPNMNYLALKPATRAVTTRSAPADDRGWFPTTTKALESLGQQELHPALFYPVAGAVALGVGFYELMRKLISVLGSLVTEFISWLISKLNDAKENPIEVGAAYIKSIVTVVVKKCAKEAVPFLSAGFDLAQGMYQTFQAIKMKVGAWLERRKIRITDGHPELLANRIEKCMTMDILSGLYALIKGAVQLALAFLAAGAQSLISALTAGVEWCIKFVMRLRELWAVEAFLKEAKEVYSDEKKIRTNAQGADASAMHASGGIIHDLPRFKKFFQSGCDASPVIAMLTINTGICGSQWQLQQVVGDMHEIEQAEFDSGTKYFSRLKDYGAKYLADSGFEFNSNHEEPRDKQFIQKLLDNAKNPNKKLPDVAPLPNLAMA